MLNEAEAERELTYQEQREDYESQVRDRHELLDELDMRIANMLDFVDPVHRAQAEHVYRKCSELVGTVALTWPEGT